MFDKECFYTFDHLPKLSNSVIEEALNVEYIGSNPYHLRILGKAITFSEIKFCKDLSKEFGHPYAVNLFTC